MALEKSVIKAQAAVSAAFDYKPREISTGTSDVARDYVTERKFQSPDFKIADLVAQQAGISQLEMDQRQDKINAQVLESMKEIEEGAYQEGYELGRTEGAEKAFQETKQEFQSKLASLENLLKEVENFKVHLLKVNEADLIRLVFLTAKKVAIRDLEENRDAVLKILEHVAGEFQADQQVIVELAQKDLDFINEFQQKSGQKIESLQRVKFQANEKVTPGGCLIKTEFGTVDASVEERVDRAWQALASRVPQTEETKS